jgi:hypothetical protein
VVVRRRSFLGSIAAFAVLAVGLSGQACVAPTLPVPPPSQPDVSEPDSSGIVTLKGKAGSATPNAEVTVWNPELNEGRVSIAKPDGSWEEQIPAVSKHILWVWQTIGYERSSTIEVKVP